MKLIEFFNIAVRSLLANKLRSALTMLGMIIGVGSVITLMSVGAGVQNMITSTFEELGTNLLFVQPSNPEAPGFAAMAPQFATASLTMDDAEALRRIRSVAAVNPTNENFVKLIAGNESTTSVIEGTTPEFQQLYAFTMASGQFISEVNIARRDMVVVLGSKTAEDLFDSEDAVGQQVKIRDKRFMVIGVLEPRGMSSFGFSWDEMVITPITTYQARLFSQTTPSGEDAVQSIVVQAASAELMDEVIEDIENILRKRHRIDADEEDDFAVMSLEHAGLNHQHTLLQDDLDINFVVKRLERRKEGQVDSKWLIGKRLGLANSFSEFVLSVVHRRGHHAQCASVGDCRHELRSRDVHHTTPDDRVLDAE